MRRLFTIVSIALLAASCGGGEDPSVPAPDGTASPAPTATDVQAGATVQLTETSLGEVLVDGEGMTLYLFTRDTEGESACVDACAQTWPPLTVEGEPEAGDGVDASKLATITRADGSTQVTYAGHPLYRYTPDEEPGDVNGQGVGDVWFAVTADGTAAEEPA